MKPFRQELSPIHFVERAGVVYADRDAVIDAGRCYSWREFHQRARRFASALIQDGLQAGDRVAFLSLNSEPMLLAHFAVPMAGGILVSINTRLTADDVRFIIDDSGATKLFYSSELKDNLSQLPASLTTISNGESFEDFLNSGDVESPLPSLMDEDAVITINYTSGTTGNPKGVMYHHRGAYLNSLAMAIDHRLTCDSRYLWTLPMFHCNGWMFTWALAAVGAQSICLPRVDPEEVWNVLGEGITHFCAAPTVLTMLIHHPAARRLDEPVRVFTAGAPPSPTLIERVTELNFQLDHVYGLTETYGPFTMNVARNDQHSPKELASYRARQGFANVCAGEIRVVDDQMIDVPADGETQGEVVMRGNVVMKGYFNDQPATDQAFAEGWFHSGDVGVLHRDGSIELRDRKKDIIISGGENISTIEVEQAVCSHVAVAECAVIAIPDDKWGEVPKAFVTLKQQCVATDVEIIEHCRQQIAHFKTPKQVEFCELPKTSTGKIQKYVLREREWKDRDRRIN